MTKSLSYGRNPLMQVRADLNIKNDSLHLIRLTTSSYLSSFLRAILEAKWRWKVEVSVLSPPVTEMTNGVRFHVQHSLPPVIIPFLFLLVFGKNFFNKHIFRWVRIKIRDSHIKTYILSVSPYTCCSNIRTSIVFFEFIKLFIVHLLQLRLNFNVVV